MEYSLRLEVCNVVWEIWAPKMIIVNKGTGAAYSKDRRSVLWVWIAFVVPTRLALGIQRDVTEVDCSMILENKACYIIMLY